MEQRWQHLFDKLVQDAKEVSPRADEHAMRLRFEQACVMLSAAQPDLASDVVEYRIIETAAFKMHAAGKIGAPIPQNGGFLFAPEGHTELSSWCPNEEITERAALEKAKRNLQAQQEVRGPA